MKRPCPNYQRGFAFSLFLLLFIMAFDAQAQLSRQPVKQPKKLPTLTPNPPDTTIVDQIVWNVRPNATNSDPGLFLTPGQTGGLQVVLKGARTNKAYTVNLRYTNSPSALSGPATVTVPAGALFTSFNVVARNTSVRSMVGVKAWVFDSTKAKTAIVTVQPSSASTCTAPNPTLVAPASARRNGSVTVVVSMSCASAVPVTLQITSSNPSMIPGPPGGLLTVAAGSTSAFYTTTTGNAASSTIVTLSAFIPGTSPIRRANDVQVVVTTQ